MAAFAERGAITRRSILGGAGAGLALTATSSAFGHGRGRIAADTNEFVPAQTSWKPEPSPPSGMVEQLAAISPAPLWYWDTGGAGPVIVLMHAFTGSSETWGYQRSHLASLGYRVIGFSRRGHYRSERGPAGEVGRLVDDLHALADKLRIGKFHLLGTAGGGFYVADFALSYPDRLLSMTLASTQGGIDEPEYAAQVTRITPPQFSALPPELKELGPSYRAANPEGMRRWLELEHAARSGAPIRQAKANRLDWISLRSIRIPKLIMTGDADLYAPPALMRMIVDRVPGWHSAIIAEAGHAAYWEQPIAFNRVLTRFLARVR
jgi:pimeloyl-ACP methyl ester carboxylesterase